MWQRADQAVEHRLFVLGDRILAARRFGGTAGSLFLRNSLENDKANGKRDEEPNQCFHKRCKKAPPLGARP